jgi:hypothetical protein
MRSMFGGANKGNRGQVSPYEAAKELHAEFGRLGASRVVITSMLPTRHDGLPYSDGRVDKSDPGIAVWCVLEGHERVFACDRWLTPGENMRAIALSIEAMRGLSRWGMADAKEKAFAGFAALPAGSGETVNAAPVKPPKRPWREVFALGPLGEKGVLGNSDLLAIVKQRYRERVAAAHPDRGGSVELAAELNEARADAEKELA